MAYSNPDEGRAVRRRHYESNKSVYSDRAKLRKRKMKAWVYTYLASHACADCGESDPIVLEFDHIDEKTKDRGVMMLARAGASEARILAEIAKCEVVCANCHRRRTTRRARDKSPEDWTYTNYADVMER